MTKWLHSSIQCYHKAYILMPRDQHCLGKLHTAGTEVWYISVHATVDQGGIILQEEPLKWCGLYKGFPTPNDIQVNPVCQCRAWEHKAEIQVALNIVWSSTGPYLDHCQLLALFPSQGLPGLDHLCLQCNKWKGTWPAPFRFSLLLEAPALPRFFLLLSPILYLPWKEQWGPWEHKEDTIKRSVSLQTVWQNLWDLE